MVTIPFNRAVRGESDGFVELKIIIDDVRKVPAFLFGPVAVLEKAGFFNTQQENFIAVFTQDRKQRCFYILVWEIPV